MDNIDLSKGELEGHSILKLKVGTFERKLPTCKIDTIKAADKSGIPILDGNHLFGISPIVHSDTTRQVFPERSLCDLRSSRDGCFSASSKTASNAESDSSERFAV